MTVEPHPRPPLRRGRAAACAILVAVLSIAAARAEIPRNSRAADDAVYPCEVPQAVDQRLAHARLLAVQTHDLNKLACAADLYYQSAGGGSADAATLAAAIAAHNNYLREVGVEHDLDFIGVQTDEWNIRLEKAGKQVQSLCTTAADREASDPALKTLCAQAELLVHHYDEPKDYVAATKRVIPKLTEVCTGAPQTLNGLALVTLGKLYLDLPTIFGGNSTRAVDLLERTREYAPNDPERLADLALAYEETGRNDDSKAVLRQLRTLKPGAQPLQALADAWMIGSGLSDRLHDAASQQNFDSRRHALFVAHPELMTRIRTAVGGHGGEDPLTGKRQY